MGNEMGGCFPLPSPLQHQNTYQELSLILLRCILWNSLPQDVLAPGLDFFRRRADKLMEEKPITGFMS